MATASEPQSISTSSRNTTAARLTTTTSRPQTGSRSRPRTAATSTSYSDNEIICAISESRGVSPTIGLSFVNVSTSEAVLCQFTDTQTYARTCHKIKVFAPSEIIYMKTANDSNLISIVAENLEVQRTNIAMNGIERKYWSETNGHDYVHYLAFPDDLESLKLSVAGNYFATCCFSAALKYINLTMELTFAPQTLRIRFEPSEGSTMIDLSTMASLELIQNLQNGKSRDCLFGLLNQTLTPMGARFLRSNVLQPSTDAEKIRKRQQALSELTSKEDMFFTVRSALKSFIDADRVLAALVIISTRQDFHFMEQSISNVLMLKMLVDGVKPIWQALAGASSEELQMIRQLCDQENYMEVESLLGRCLNADVRYSSKPLELRNQRVYGIQAGVNSFLDVARQAYKELNADVNDMFNKLKEEGEIAIELKYDSNRQYYLRFPASEIEDKSIPETFINTYKKNKYIECQTLDLIKMNQKLKDAHNEVICLSDATVQELIDQVRSTIHPLFKISESVAMLDMLAGFAQLVTTSTNEYVRPEIHLDSLMIKSGRHPIREKVQHQHDRFVPNDVYATPQNRFHVITGCNMSGKSTYIRSVALMAIMAQIGCFVPAEYASFPISHEIFARIATDDNIEANVSTFASEMREMAFILRNMSPRSLVIVDELGRGTSTADGLAIAIAIAEALIESKAYVWFVTHFRDLPRILANRAGVANLHLSVDISEDYSKMTMRYKIADGYEEEKFYGLALARAIGLPDDVVEVGTRVSKALHERNEARKRNPRATAVARKRKLILNVREQLSHARESAATSEVGAEALRDWLRRLQLEFTVRMRAIDADAEAAVGAD
ncbi:DNA mismatch repair protein MSH4 [Cladophialophora psammophila CBS 110553]|uniref:DNA mismatch repair protein MSH4 n=1 Tax=Cladophialophora psammophila CBS 110553 TaxID=1182543 RepID=W9X690_9EURO|nr:DNA mismatch repair protein MSH4 [Cladophialophora psammophila CBS 110553]EXJ75992.1 DNA mismatch repair protein MSH4 [Cladophialophora psammophila CBS 110553]